MFALEGVHDALSLREGLVAGLFGGPCCERIFEAPELLEDSPRSTSIDAGHGQLAGQDRPLQGPSVVHDPNEGQVEIRLDQIQTDGSLFDMPLEIGFYFKEGTPKLMEQVRIDKRSNVYTIKVEEEPEEVLLDPNLWVLMTADFKGNKD